MPVPLQMPAPQIQKVFAFFSKKKHFLIRLTHREKTLRVFALSCHHLYARGEIKI
jgi:hypothetical protein